MLPENAVTDDLAKRLNLKKEKPKVSTPKETADSESPKNSTDEDDLLREVKLHRKDLVRFFKTLTPEA